MRGVDKKDIIWVAHIQFCEHDDVTLRFDAFPHKQNILSAIAHVEMFAKPFWPFEIISVTQETGEEE